MPSVSLAQNRYVHAAAARGEGWAAKWLREQREQRGHRVPRVERVAEVRGHPRGQNRRRNRPGRPRMPVSQLSKDGHWKRAQRADNRPPNRGMVRHHVDHDYGRRSPRTVYMSRAQHNREHRAAVVAEVKRRRRARKERA